MVNNWLRTIQSGLLGNRCSLCGIPSPGPRELCPECAAELPWNHCPCPRCGLPGTGGHPCGRCRRSRPVTDAATLPLRYAHPVDGLIQVVKFGRRLQPAQLLGELLADAVEADDIGVDAIVPVPLHPSRLRERGFNQALELARPVARRLDLPLHARLLLRHTATAAQSGLDARARRRNVRAAFDVAGPLPAPRIAIIDDVVTTGHTVAEVARVLRRAGAERVEIWACARASPGDG